MRRVSGVPVSGRTAAPNQQPRQCRREPLFAGQRRQKTRQPVLAAKRPRHIRRCHRRRLLMATRRRKQAADAGNTDPTPIERPFRPVARRPRRRALRRNSPRRDREDRANDHDREVPCACALLCESTGGAPPQCPNNNLTMGVGQENCAELPKINRTRAVVGRSATPPQPAARLRSES